MRALAGAALIAWLQAAPALLARDGKLSARDDRLSHGYRDPVSGRWRTLSAQPEDGRRVADGVRR